MKRTRLITDDELARPYAYLDHADAEGLEPSACAVDGQPGLTMIIFTPSTPSDAALVRSLVGATPRVRHTRYDNKISSDVLRAPHIGAHGVVMKLVSVRADQFSPIEARA